MLFCEVPYGHKYCVSQNWFSKFSLLLDLPDFSVERCGTCSSSVMILRETVSRVLAESSYCKHTAFVVLSMNFAVQRLIILIYLKWKTKNPSQWMINRNWIRLPEVVEIAVCLFSNKGLQDFWGTLIISITLLFQKYYGSFLLFRRGESQGISGIDRD